VADKVIAERHRQLEQDLAHVSQEMYIRNKELADTNRMLRLLSTIDAAVLETDSSLETVCQNITTAIVQNTDYPLVAILSRPEHQHEHLQLMGLSVKNWPEAATFFTSEQPSNINLHHQMVDSFATTSQLLPIETLSIKQIAGFLGCPELHVQKTLDRVPVKSIFVVKLTVRGQLVGLLGAGFFSTFDQVAQTDTSLLRRLGDSIGVALDNKLLFQENQRVLRQLRRSNTKLQALDEAKDDFISMASHQLRTPLTSIKGYTSMLLEGDAGDPLNPTEERFLRQSFASSQRMVCLIADLLNLSRLKTGKFVIDAKPLNLADVVADEIDQLQAIAAGKEVTLKYKRIAHFPTLMLDENKIRQVIMNFTDNAIYYTPSGGKIVVELVDKGRSIELTINDNGIGVPKAEQPHLFTKFYRATNARQARPDGTGIGLFMAKKIIIAQGGWLIFRSKVGEGSSFGFGFEKSKLAAVPANVPDVVV
jgi:signal transduction histidine kinase